MTEKQKLAKRIRTARELAGLSQGQAAKLLNLHRPTISEIEAGRRNVKDDELDQIAELYGVESNWLTNGDDGLEKLSDEIIAAARELSSMKDEDVSTLIETIRMLKGKN